MNLFADYIQPLTDWLQTNPGWALFITFFIALTESLAIIGSIIPGSVTMTAIGILAGSGIMRVDLTLLAATIGAIAGDSLSYFLGFFYSDRLLEIWPFRNYPSWIKYGKDFFARHGGKSVLIGRFIGPLRSIIPVIAGILHMKQWRFLIANSLSAFGWALLYVMPGVVIGAASHSLSTESATQLFVLILIILAVIWFLGVFLKKLVSRLHTFMKKYLHSFWFNLKNSVYFPRLYKALTPKNEKDHYPTALLLLVSLLCLLFFMGLSILSFKQEWLSIINNPIHVLMQSFYTPLLKALLIICNQFSSTITLIGIYLVCCIWFITHKNLRLIKYISSVLITSICLSWIASHLIINPRPHDLRVVLPGSSFFATNFEVATAFYGFLLLYINTFYSLMTRAIRSCIVILLALSGLATIYLGNYWFTDVLAAFFSGALIAIVYYLIYRKDESYYQNSRQSNNFSIILLAGILLLMILSTYSNFKTQSYRLTPYVKKYTLKKDLWWNQQDAILPIFQLNRLGKKVNILNIQYLGDLELLQNNLEMRGWKTHNESFFVKLLMRMNSKSNQIKFPLFTHLYENKPPELIMTFQDPGTGIILEFELWESNYHIDGLNIPLWLGTLHQNIHDYKKNKPMLLSNPNKPLTHIMPALDNFTLRRIELPKGQVKMKSYSIDPVILLIKSPEI